MATWHDCPRPDCGKPGTVPESGEAPWLCIHCGEDGRVCDDCGEWHADLVQTGRTRGGDVWLSCPECRARDTVPAPPPLGCLGVVELRRVG